MYQWMTTAVFWHSAKAEGWKLKNLCPLVEHWSWSQMLFFKLKDKTFIGQNFRLNTMTFVDHICIYFFMLSSDWLRNFLIGGSKIIRFVANTHRLDLPVFIQFRSIHYSHRPEVNWLARKLVNSTALHME